MVERQPSKLRVAGSNPVFRFQSLKTPIKKVILLLREKIGISRMRKMNDDKMLIFEGVFSLSKSALTALELAHQRQLDARESLLRIAVDGAEKISGENFTALLGTIERMHAAEVDAQRWASSAAVSAVSEAVKAAMAVSEKQVELQLRQAQERLALRMTEEARKRFH